MRAPQGHRLLRRAVELGVTLIDTPPTPVALAWLLQRSPVLALREMTPTWTIGRP